MSSSCDVFNCFFHWMCKMKYSCHQDSSVIHGWFVYLDLVEKCAACQVIGNPILLGVVFVYPLSWCVRGLKSLNGFQELNLNWEAFPTRLREWKLLPLWMFHRIKFVLLIVRSLSCILNRKCRLFSVLHKHRLQECFWISEHQTLLKITHKTTKLK